MRLHTCVTCPNWGDFEERKTIDEKEHRPCHGDLPRLSGDPRGIGRFPFLPFDGWCAHHGLLTDNSTPTHTTADTVAIGPAEDQPN